VLGGDLIEQFDLDQIEVELNPLDARPQEFRPTRNTATGQIAAPMKFTHVQATRRQFFDRYPFGAFTHFYRSVFKHANRNKFTRRGY
jgi:hypothetical protein